MHQHLAWFLGGVVVLGGCKRTSAVSALREDAAPGDPSSADGLGGCQTFTGGNLDAIICQVLASKSMSMQYGPYTAQADRNKSPDRGDGLRVVYSAAVLGNYPAYVITFWDYVGGKFALRQGPDAIRVHTEPPGETPDQPRFVAGTFTITSVGNAIITATDNGPAIDKFECSDCHTRPSYTRSPLGGLKPDDLAKNIAQLIQPAGANAAVDPVTYGQVIGPLMTPADSFTLSWQVPPGGGAAPAPAADPNTTAGAPTDTGSGNAAE